MRILAIADGVHPYIYRESFPSGLPEFDVVLGAGDLNGDYLEYVATKVRVPVLYVHGNHSNEFLWNPMTQSREMPQGVWNVHGKVVECAGITIAGWGGIPKYRDGERGHLTSAEEWSLEVRLGQQMFLRKLRGKTLDVLLSHAPPSGVHAGSDYAHRGSTFLSRFSRHSQPRVHVHGHIHDYEGKKHHYTETWGTKVYNAYGYTVIEL